MGTVLFGTLPSPFLCQTPLKPCHDSTVATQRAAEVLGNEYCECTLAVKGSEEGEATETVCIACSQILMPHWHCSL